MSISCECGYRISKTVISMNKNGKFLVQYGIGFMMDYKVKGIIENSCEILPAGSRFCPHYLPENFSYIEEYFTA